MAGLAFPAAAELPVPCGGACIQAGGPGQWISSGSVQVPTVIGNRMTIRQSSANATLNWQTFNIGAGYGVEFQQPSAGAVALNRVWDPSSNPSQILGTLKANGQIYLINRNGILFGANAKVDVATLLASSLDMTASALNKGLIRAFTEDRQPAFTAALDADGNVVNGNVTIENGAVLRAADGGQILLFAPNVSNRGDIEAPNGQAVLAAGNKIYLVTSSDSNLRGFVVQVDADGISDAQLQAFLRGELDELPLGRTENFGSIDVATGNASLVGLAVNQAGRISATTSVQANGTVSLRAVDRQDRTNLTNNGVLTPTRAGLVDIAAGSVTEVLPDYGDPDTTVDINAQPVSQITASGYKVLVGQDARLTATGGSVQLTAEANPSIDLTTQTGDSPNDSRVFIDKGAIIDVSGSTIALPADRLILDVELRGEELKDSPLQRDGVLRGQTVTVDLRQTGVRADGTTWIGTPLADLSGAVAAIKRSVGERTVNGGTVNILSQGDVIAAPDATINVSGGRIDYAAGKLHTTQLISNGRVYDISAADPTLTYSGIIGQYSRTSAKWGMTQTWVFPGTVTTYSPAFSQGFNAGSVTLNAPRLIMDGNIRGSVTTGPSQRQAATAPAPGLLVIGNQTGAAITPPNYRTGSVVFDDRTALDGLIAGGFDPRTDALPADAGPVVIRPSLFSASGVGRAVVLSNGSITIAKDAELNLPAGGSLSLTGGHIDIEGDVTAPGGTIKAAAGRTHDVGISDDQDLNLGAGARLDVSGQWVNDGGPMGIGQGTVWIDGGSVSLSSQFGNVNLENGSSIDASGGGWLQTSGAVKDGKGGSIAVATTSGGATRLGAELDASALKRGGSLSLTTNALCVSATVCSGDLYTGGLSSDVLVLAPGFFGENGFASYQLTTTQGDLVIAGDADIHPVELNRVLDATFQSQKTGTSLNDFSQLGLLPDYLRQPTGVSFISTGNHPAQLRLEEGASITTDPGAAVRLASSSRMWVDGSITARGGTIGLTLSKHPAIIDFVPDEAIWLGAMANLDVSGAARLQPDSQGRRIGDVLDGGTISVAANRGYVIAENGSRLNVSGTAQPLDLPDANGIYAPRDITSNAGSINISAAEGIFIEGTLSGHAGGANALGGTLSLTLDGNTRGEPNNATGVEYPDSANNYPHVARTVTVVNGDNGSDLSGYSYDTLDASFTATHDGIARLRTTQVAAGGFDALSLTARNLLTNDGFLNVRSPGAVSIATDLGMSRSLVVDSPNIVVAAPEVTLSAPYVALGSTDINSQAVSPPVAAANTLTVDAGWIDLIGNSAVSGADRVVLHSDSDLRLRASPNLQTATRALTGSFTTAGDVELAASQLYPATLVDFTISALLPAEGPGTITVRDSGGTAGPVLSAGGAVRLRADQIEVDGAIKAPLGTIDLQAGRNGGQDGDLILGPGSLLSTSAAGAIIPFGRTEGGLDWVYDLGNTQKMVFRSDLDPLPQQSIKLSGGNVELRQGSRLDVSGGGDLQAYEFVPGVGGSRDVLALSQAPNSYAILPALGATIAPFDQQESAGFAPRIGTTVHLDAGSGVPAGDYVLLPARYALLPGAYLITELPTYRDLPDGVTLDLPNGLRVVAGQYGVAGTDLIESRTRGFSVMSSVLLRDVESSTRPAEYTLGLASAFFTNQTAGGRLPIDAGIVSISAGQSLDLHPTLNGTAAEGGRGAALDITADQILVTADGSGGARLGALPIDADALNSLNAESILLGGRRTDAADGTHINVASRDVTLGVGAVLQGPELILAATDQVTLESGAGLSGTGATHGTPDSLIVSGDGALLRAAGANVRDVVRSGMTGTTGVIEAAAGSFIAATGAAAVDATADVHFAGDLRVSGAALLVSAPRINLGDAPANTPGFTIGAAALNGFDADQLTLRGREGIDVYGAPALSAQTLTFDTPLLITQSGDTGAQTTITAHDVTLTNTAAASSAQSAGSTYGSLSVSANDITLGQGAYAIAGFNDVTLSASNTLLGRSQGQLHIVGAGLNLGAGVLGGERGATTDISADGAVVISNGGAVATLPTDAIGAALSITAPSIHHSGNIVVPAGTVSISATGAGGIDIANGAIIDAGGVIRLFDTTQAFAPGGAVGLAAAAGDVAIEAGSRITVAGATGSDGSGGDAGAVSIIAPQGAIRVDGDLIGAAATGQRQGRIDLDGHSIDHLDALNAALNHSGFTDERVLRIRSGDAALTTDIRAHDIEITVDGIGGGGALTIGGVLDASGDKGGQVKLAAAGDLTLQPGASIDSSATAAGGKGGTVELMSASGGVKALAGSRVNTSGGPASADGSTSAGQDGEVDIRVSRDVLAAAVAGTKTVVLDGSIVGDVIAEGVETYDLGAGNAVIGAAQTSSSSVYYSDATAFMQAAPAIAAALGQSGNPDFHVRPGIELRAGSDITLAAPWDLYDWRFNGEPGELTLRAGGNLSINQNLSDGVSTSYFNFLEQPAIQSWGYRLIAGADLTSASPLAVKSAPDTGDLVLANDTLIRTGTGDIDIAAARDVRLGNSGSVIYTLGVPVTDISADMRQFVEFFALKSDGLQSAALAEHGGSIRISAGRDMIGVPSDQLITDWLWRAGSAADDSFPTPTMWGVEFNRFRQGVGALAGGDVTLSAGRDIDNVSAVLPTIGVPIGASAGPLQFENEVDIRGGGDLVVEAGRDIGGGVYYVGRGTGELDAGGSIRAGENWNYLGNPLHTTLALGDGAFALMARQDVTIETVFNPTLTAPSQQQFNSTPFQNWLTDFSTYAPTSRVALDAVAGDVLLNGDVGSLVGAAGNTLVFNNLGSQDATGLYTIYPPSLYATAFAGDIIDGNARLSTGRGWIKLFPAAQGQVELLAQGDVRFVGNGVLLSGADPALLPTPDQPQVTTADRLLPSLLTLFQTFGRYAYADTPVHSTAYTQAAGYDGPQPPALVVANTGDIDMSQWPASNAEPAVMTSKPVKLIAGRDILDPSVAALHPEVDDVSVISAGGDIRYSVTRNANHQIIPQSAEISVDGPGDLLLMAGGDIDLKASPGITSRGNTVDPVLAPAGANVTLMTGLGSKPDYDAFITRYLQNETIYHDQLAAYLASRRVSATSDQLVSAFRALAVDEQIPFLNQVLFAELRASGRQAAAAGSDDFSRGFTALATMFPNADPAAHPGGDVSLFFSRVYTLAGGDIDILAPSGTVNVGLSTPPSSFGISKSPSQLGIVAQRTGDVNILSGGDTLVNQSRVFAADGGSILMWSSAGNIDAGRGAKSAISAPPPVITYDPNTGLPSVVFPPALTGSGIRAFVTTEGRKPGDVDLFAPAGVINAGDAGIGSAGNVTLAATQVIGANNIDVGGVAVGVPVADTGSLAAGFTGVSNVSSAATKSTEEALSASNAESAGNTPLADAAFAVIDVIVLGLGEDAPGAPEAQRNKDRGSE